jgi:hypothetical protein
MQRSTLLVSVKATNFALTSTVRILIAKNFDKTDR